MPALYLDRRNARVQIENQQLIVRVEGEITTRLPLSLLDRVIILGAQTIDTRVLTTLADASIPVHLVSGRGHQRMASVLGAPGNDARRRLAQYAAWHHPDRHDGLLRDLLRLKLQAQYRTVARWRKARPDARRPLTAALETLRAQRAALDAAPNDREKLRGIEGAASAASFRALKAILPPSLAFDGRKRRPPPDPVNAALSLAYTLAYALAVEAAHTAGLDPAIGFLHEPAHGRQSLAADLMEPLRPRIEYLIWQLFKDRRLTKDHFDQQKAGACLLGKRGRSLFYAAWEEHSPVYRRWLRRLTTVLVRRLQEHTDDPILF